ncbi:fumarylacetoacetate hydrolase family protein [Variovorax ginsengisoli]|uniref:2-keto-4-pentenoate hydratase/2-oxohepta-3-ene-1,7-dioic acid hydratase in catechol pathway n=1 Tax=Variovorax ginsengisoli TaxID=363844 RepID=A0ABT9SC69_9BURK|nr:fumarylacetoacetate hydrolase family protein [Variovorax ginsengisoli]MDP9901933.1 2-keto-4-pentenoate hydratase/2-oxohepta-3-ene-1,7-dioic acid hydratase in catechol pathway [Variovorax ginsengisoli]
MKLAFFDSYRLGLVVDDAIIDISNEVPAYTEAAASQAMIWLIENFDDKKPSLSKAAEQGERIPLANVRLRPPIPKPGNIVCMAVNYMENGTLAERPLINAFHKASSGVIGHGDTMVLPDMAASVFEAEAEIALVIGRRADKVAAADWQDYVFGYVGFIDGSARGVKPDRNTFFQMKSRATFAPLGPWIVTADEIDDPQNLNIAMRVNGTLRQDFNTDDMAHSISKSIEWLSHIHPLEPGDIVATGTNHRGLGAVQHGDRLELTVERVGTLSVVVQDDLRRTWSTETRLERQTKGLPALSPQLSGKYTPS